MSNTRSFLYTIAHNLAKDWYKKKKSYSLDEQMEQGYDPSDRQLLSAQQEAQYREVIDAMDGLEQKDREILLLRYVEGLDPKDIASILEESANAVSVRIHRATKQLQEIMHIHV
jgi:RNA polymerase sigma-70 factor (ECF subfamily)